MANSSHDADDVGQRIHEALTRSYPPVRASMCAECPWSRKAVPGHLGPYSAEQWCDVAHSDAPIACHKTVVAVGDDGHGEWDDPALRQCAGAAIFRANVAKTPRNPHVGRADRPDYQNVFTWDDQFIAHHDGGAASTTNKNR